MYVYVCGCLASVYARANRYTFGLMRYVVMILMAVMAYYFAKVHTPSPRPDPNPAFRQPELRMQKLTYMPVRAACYSSSGSWGLG